MSIEKSIATTKADASRRLFDIDGTDITWAVFDTGIDARHPAFRKKDRSTGKPYNEPLGTLKDLYSNNTRIRGTYDFTKFRSIIAGIHEGTLNTSTKKRQRLVQTTSDVHDKALDNIELSDSLSQIESDLKSGRLLNWSTIAPLLKVPHNAKEYVPPGHPHGTHVAGIIAANDMSHPDSKLVGMCPGIELYDIRVMDEGGKGEEFNILAALQFLRWLNNQNDSEGIQGMNLSFSIPHEVASYACGQTPVCESCDRLVGEGIVVVTAAGNLGQTMFQSSTGVSESGFRMVNITDPGNAELVITVGSTHRNRPHSYGVSYFSSKGPTGDGRLKPDLVAPGEKIVSSSINDGTVRMDGTSMAAPHVSGAAALLMSKHRELIGRPRVVKEVLCKSATDLGREKYFQGGGMLDVLRAIQSV
jgi:subtilisin family serine protease